MGIQMIKTRCIGRLFLTGILWGISVWAWAQPDASLRQELANRIKNIRLGMGATGCLVEAGTGKSDKELPGAGGGCSCGGWERHADFV